jgi:stage II sporulation protein GA (sporulation sigma-E factor processing peptidase)
MTVYVELVFINNFIIDFMLLKCSTVRTKARTSIWQLLFCSIFSALGTIFLPFISKNAYLSLIKIAFGFLIVLFAIKKESFKKYIFTTIIFFAFTFFTGGMLIGLSNIFSVNTNNIVFIYLEFVPVCIIGLICIKIINVVYRKKNVINFIYECEILLNGKRIKTDGFLDTGNNVYKNFIPIVFCSKDVTKIIKSKISNLKTDVIHLKTVTGFGQTKVVLNAKIKIYSNMDKHIYFNVGLALTDNIFKTGVILHPSIVKG